MKILRCFRKYRAQSLQSFAKRAIYTRRELLFSHINRISPLFRDCLQDGYDVDNSATSEENQCPCESLREESE